MGRYISFRAEYADNRAFSDMLSAAVGHSIFRPHGLAAINYQESGNRLFLSGFGLESFITRERLPRAMSITFDTSIKSADYLAYTERLSAWIRRGNRPAKELSPHEQLDPKYAVTFLDSMTLSDLSVNEYNKWANECEDLGVYLFGTFALAVDDADERDWAIAYRFLFDDGYPELGTPFVMFHMLTTLRRQKPRAATTIMLTSESTVWLHGSSALNGKVTKASADTNLANFATAAELLLTPTKKPHETALSVESQTFRRDLGRIESAFSHLVR